MPILIGFIVRLFTPFSMCSKNSRHTDVLQLEQALAINFGAINFGANAILVDRKY